MPANYDSFALKQEFNSLFREARAIDRVANPHPITRMPVEIIREIFEAAARVDPDASSLLTMTSMAWKKLVIESSKMWSNIRIDVNNDDMLERLQLSLLLSKNWPLDIAITGVCASDEIFNDLIPHVHRIRSLELCLYREARIPFRVLGGTPPDGLSSLCRLSIEPASYHDDGFVLSKHLLESASRNQNAIDDTDLFLIKSLPLLSSLTAIVLHAPGVANMDNLQLPRVESLRLVMKDAPTVLENLTCNRLKNLDVVLDDTSREGWWDLLVKCLTYPRLESLALDVMLDRAKNEWSKHWDSQDFKRLPSQPIIKCMIVALSFSDDKYRSPWEPHTEYLCGDLLQDLTDSVPSLNELHLLHVPYLHAPFIWPSPEVLHNLQRLELEGPADIHDECIPVIDLPNLRDLRYYGFESLQRTQLPSLRTPFLEYLEIMYHGHSIHPILMREGRHGENRFRPQIASAEYSKSRGNSSKDFPAEESLPDLQGTVFLPPVIHQSVALRELRLYFGNNLFGPSFTLTRFPELRALHCSASIFRFIDAPKLEDLHLLWSESEHSNSLPSTEGVQAMLRGLITLDIYSHFDPRFHRGSDKGDMEFGQWIPHLHLLQTLTLGLCFVVIDGLLGHLWRNPRCCPKLTTIDSFVYPKRWSYLRDCIEKRNHFVMEDPSVHPIRTLRFPLALHPNISDRLKESLSGEFASPVVAVPLQPYALKELIQPDDEVGRRPQQLCDSCIRSGNAFGCLRPEMDSREESYFTIERCNRHWNHGPDRGVAITAYNLQLSGYLEGA